MDEKIEGLKEKATNFVNNETVKGVAKMVAKYALIAVVSVVVAAGIKAAGNAIQNAKTADEVVKAIEN